MPYSKTRELILTNAWVVTATEVVEGTVAIRDGRIVDLDAARSHVASALDLGGDWLLPGLVEVHTDNLEKHLMPRPKVRWPTFPAIVAHDAQVAAAGITTVLDAIGIGDLDHESVRVESLSESIGLLDRAAKDGLLRAQHFLHLRCELGVPDLMALFEPFVADPRVHLVSLMDHTPGQRQWTDLSHYRTYVTGKKGWSDSKVEDMLVRLRDTQVEFVERHRHEVVELCRTRGIALATHDDTTLDHVAQAVAEGVQICEFPTTVEAAEAAHNHDLQVVMGAPNVVRGGSHSGNVAAIELARLGLVDALSSDYVPASLLHAAFMLHDDAGWSIPRAIASISRNPARMVGLLDRGEIAVGLRGDVIRVRRSEASDHGAPVVLHAWREGVRVV